MQPLGCCPHTAAAELSACRYLVIYIYIYRISLYVTENEVASGSVQVLYRKPILEKKKIKATWRQSSTTVYTAIRVGHLHLCFIVSSIITSFLFVFKTKRWAAGGMDNNVGCALLPFPKNRVLLIVSRENTRHVRYVSRCAKFDQKRTTSWLVNNAKCKASYIKRIELDQPKQQQ
jgi:hypothetical protein